MNACPRVKIACAVCSFLCLGVSGPARAGFQEKIAFAGGGPHRYQVYLPDSWSARKKWPVILFLHGWGERGRDGARQVDGSGLGPAVRAHPERFPFVIVFPQSGEDKVWSDADMSELALKALDASVEEFNGDRNRLYLTGLSMGGYGVWELASRRPGLFAALAPVCGGLRWPKACVLAPRGLPRRVLALHREDGAYEKAARSVGRTPVWIFHGDADPTIPVAESRAMAKALSAAGCDPRYTEYPGVGHNAWDFAYADPELPAWLLRQTLKGSGAANTPGR
jgi:predicted peptidase